MPLILAPGFPYVRKFFGVEFEGGYLNNSTVIQRASDAGVAWMRLQAFSWRDIEPTRYSTPVYNWSSVNEAALVSYAAKGFTTVATVRYTPSWAQKYPPSTYCGPVAESYLDEFAQFMQNVVARYSVPPYNVMYYQIGNEPDVDRSIVPGDGPIGCWGEPSDPLWYGGKYYATMLKAVYPAMKAANPNVKVSVGALLMDCDPTHPPPGKSCLPTQFFEGILRGGGGPYFDAVSFNGYGFYWDANIIDEENINWDDRGGLVLGKINFLKEVMARYSISKPIIHSEAALICHPNNTLECNPPVADFYEKMADYVVWNYVRTWAAGVITSIWYPMVESGWYYTAILNSNYSSRPAYNSFRFMAQELNGAQYVRQITLYPMLRIYEFSARGLKIWAAWSPDYNIPYTLTLPAGTIRVLDRNGNTIQPVGGKLTVSSPIYIEMTP